jgi:putative transposase
MRANALQARPRRRALPSDHGERPTTAFAQNVLDRQFSADQPNRKCIADFTYIWTAEGWLYVAAGNDFLSDLFSRRVVGWSMKAEMTSQLVTDALMMAIWRRGKSAALLHHSDRGSQGGFNRSLQYQQLKVVMAAYTRASDRCNRKKLCSPGRPSAWRRENHRRF